VLGPPLRQSMFGGGGVAVRPSCVRSVILLAACALFLLSFLLSQPSQRFSGLAPPASSYPAKSTDSTEMQHFSLWAMPPEGSPFYALADDAIRSLSAKMKCVPFEPHVTVLGAFGVDQGLDQAQAEAKTRQLCSSLKPYNLKVQELAAGKHFFQCVLLKMEPTQEVRPACPPHFRPTPCSPGLPPALQAYPCTLRPPPAPQACPRVSGPPGDPPLHCTAAPPHPCPPYSVLSCLHFTHSSPPCIATSSPALAFATCTCTEVKPRRVGTSSLALHFWCPPLLVPSTSGALHFGALHFWCPPLLVPSCAVAGAQVMEANRKARSTMGMEGDAGEGPSSFPVAVLCVHSLS